MFAWNAASDKRRCSDGAALHQQNVVGANVEEGIYAQGLPTWEQGRDSSSMFRLPRNAVLQQSASGVTRPSSNPAFSKQLGVTSKALQS